MAASPDAVDEAHFARERGFIEAALAGDGRAFRALVEPHLGMLFRIAARVARDAALAEDAVQETLALAWQRLASYRHDMPFRAFLASVAARQAHTLRRAEGRRWQRELGSDAPDGFDAPDARLQASQLAERASRALAAMPPKRREVALLRLDAGLSYREIAQALDTTEGSARVLVHKALAELEQELASDAEKQDG